MKTDILVFGVLTALFWGAYGPALALSRGALGSPFKPYFMIGLAYLAWSVVGGALGMRLKGDAFTFSGVGASWGLVAGSLGALGNRVPFLEAPSPRPFWCAGVFVSPG